MLQEIDRLVIENIPLVVSIARNSFAGASTPLEDRVQAGCIGLMRAARGFDPAKGCRFSTYAAPWIKDSIGRQVASDHSIRLPYWALTEVRRQSGSPRGRGATRDQAGRIASLCRLALTPECVTVDPEPDPEDERAYRAGLVRSALASLDSVDRELFRLRYGLDGSPPLTIRDAARALGIGYDRALASLRAGIGRMRDKLSGEV